MELSVEKPESIVKLYDENTGLWKFVKMDKGPAKYVKIIEKNLRRLGLSKNEVKVFLYLARTGEHKASEISEALSLHRTETYRILRDLEKKGLVLSVFEKPLKFIATPFDKALDVLVDAKKMKLNLLEKKKDGLVSIWLSLPQPEMEPRRKEVFQVLEGEEQISSKAEEILDNVKKEAFIFISEHTIASFYHSGILDKLEKMSRSNVEVKLLTNYSPKSCFFIEKIKLKKAKYSVSEIDDELPTFVLVDDAQILLLIRKDGGNKKVAALWTNYVAFIRALKALFLELWNKEN
ncbi:helix-turn-helix domain-containing protein [Candidatus Bathyarchaeota archaeon]|nr:helix-turn-helix domain-containing protein [Candidatus Bathyarchaeota archaeon]